MKIKLSKLLAVALAVIMILSVVPISAFAGGWGLDNLEGIFYYGISNGTAIITHRSNIPSDGKLIIPSTLGGFPVAGIDNGAFSEDCSDTHEITSVIIPDGVTWIGIDAFSGCSKLNSIQIADSVTEIGVSAFYDTGYYNNDDNWEDGTLYIDNCLIEAPQDISGEYVIKDGTRVIAINAFWRCSETEITSITIPESVISIGAFAFAGCTGLTSITIPDSVTFIGSYAFSGCSGLTSITIPDRVIEIGNSAFSDCTELTSITIPDSVTEIGENAFSGTAWYNNQPDGLVYAGKVAYKYKGTCPTNVTIKEGTLGIAYHAFSGYTGLTSVTIPNSVTKIGYAAFSDCSGLTNITIPNSITSIGKLAFSRCSGLTSIAIPDSVTSIGDYAFSGCTGLTSITIPDSVTCICEGTFEKCSGIASITIPDSVTWIGNEAFSGCTGLTSITIPDSVTKIGDYAFSGCTGLTSITIPDSVTSIGAYAFGWCSGLTSITIPDSVTSIDAYAFRYCENLTDVYYTGTEQQKNSIAISDYGNDYLLNATWHYNYVLPCEHTNITIKNAKKATCTENGYTGDKVCAYCSEILEQGEVIPALGHKYSWKITKVATPEEDGIKEEFCPVCGEKTGKTEVLLYTGHVVGDIDGSGAPNNQDLVLLFQYLSGWDVTVNKEAVDINGDGKENNQDLVLLFQFLSGWNVEIF